MTKRTCDTRRLLTRDVKVRRCAAGADSTVYTRVSKMSDVNEQRNARRKWGSANKTWARFSLTKAVQFRRSYSQTKKLIRSGRNRNRLTLVYMTICLNMGVV